MSGERRELDARGLICPIPVLKARKVLLSLPENAVLTVQATDANAPADFELFCHEQGYTLVSVTAVAGGFEIVVMKKPCQRATPDR